MAVLKEKSSQSQRMQFAARRDEKNAVCLISGKESK